MDMQSCKPDISVIIVNWNTRDMLLACVESLYAETKESYLEIIVVDNNSQDGSADALIASFPEVVCIRNKENLGFARANNQGIRLARGTFVCLVNSDIIALDAVLSKMCAFLDHNPDVGALAPRTLGRDLNVRMNCREYPTLRNVFSQTFFLDKLFPRVKFLRGRLVRDYDYETVREIEAVSGCFLMVRREILEQVGLLDERFFIYSEDVDWCYRMHKAGWKIIYYPKAQAIHYGGSSSSNEPIRFNLELTRANLQYWLKHYGQFQTSVFWMLQIIGGMIRLTGTCCLALAPRGSSPRYRTQALSHLRTLSWLLTRGLAGVAGRSLIPVL